MTSLTEDEIDDFLYFSRANELQDLKDFLPSILTAKNSSGLELVKVAVDNESGNTALHYASANGHLGMSRLYVKGYGF
jgi:hypothetical protein